MNPKDGYDVLKMTGWKATDCASMGKCHRAEKRVSINDQRVLTHYIKRCRMCGSLVTCGRDWTVIE